MMVRTTLTLDEDVVRKLHSEMRRSGRSFKETVNDYLRRGLNVRNEVRETKEFVIRPRPMGRRRGLSVENLGELLERIEGPSHR